MTSMSTLYCISTLANGNDVIWTAIDKDDNENLKLDTGENVDNDQKIIKKRYYKYEENNLQGKLESNNGHCLKFDQENCDSLVESDPAANTLGENMDRIKMINDEIPAYSPYLE